MSSSIAASISAMQQFGNVTCRTCNSGSLGKSHLSLPVRLPSAFGLVFNVFRFMLLALHEKYVEPWAYSASLSSHRLTAVPAEGLVPPDNQPHHSIDCF